VEAAAFVRSDASLAAPDLELMLCVALWLDEGLTPPSEHGFGVAPAVLQPKSRGSVSLRSADPLAAPAIRPNYLSVPDDMRVLMRGVQLARRIVAARAFDQLRGVEIEPGAAVARDEEVEAWVRSRAQTVYHPVGTCRMGTDALAVVDPELRVRGLDGLRVADASVMPVLNRGHTAAPVMAIGERAADLISGAVPSSASLRLAA
jgi:choline dehydrogenase